MCGQGVLRSRGIRRRVGAKQRGAAYQHPPCPRRHRIQLRRLALQARGGLCRPIRVVQRAQGDLYRHAGNGPWPRHRAQPFGQRLCRQHKPQAQPRQPVELAKGPHHKDIFRQFDPAADQRHLWIRVGKAFIHDQKLDRFGKRAQGVRGVALPVGVVGVDHHGKGIPFKRGKIRGLGDLPAFGP